MEVMKKYWVAMLGGVVLLGGLTYFGVQFSNNGQKGQPKETTSVVKETTKNPEKTTKKNEVKPPMVERESVQLNTGKTVTMGDTIEFYGPTFYEGKYIFNGTVTDMYPETGEIQFCSRLGIAVLNYRYVIDFDGIDETFDYDGPVGPNTFKHPLRAVVALDENGNEHIQYLRQLDGNDLNYMPYRIKEMKEYAPFTFHRVFYNEENVDKEYVDFYRECGPKIE